MHTLLIAALLHPGDLSRWELAALIGIFIAFFVLPIVVIAIIIYRVIVGHSRDSDGNTLRLNDDNDP